MSDLISREYMKSLGATCIASRSKDGNMFPIVSIDELPSVQPELSNNSKELENKNGELISRQDAIDVASRECHELFGISEQLPSVQPRKRKWIEASEDWRNQITWWQCSECGTPSSIKSNFCPNCGSYNGGEQDGKKQLEKIWSKMG